jgi:hypothetical protein
MKTILSLFLAVAFLSAVSIAGAADPLVGTWTLNLAKSKITPPAPKSETRTYSESDDGTISVTEKIVSAEGNENNVSASYKLDGKEYPVTGAPDSDSVSAKRITSHTTEYTLKKAGKVVQTARRVVSKDGKTLTITERGTDSHGAKSVDIEVFDKE